MCRSTGSYLVKARPWNDFLVLSPTKLKDAPAQVERIFSAFQMTLHGLAFTKELSVDGHIRFLDLDLHLECKPICWAFAPWSKKQLLTFSSAHLRTVKRAVALGAMKNALSCSWLLRINRSFDCQLKRLKDGGFPEPLLSTFIEVLVRDIRCFEEKEWPELDRLKVIVIPYVHAVSHRVKKAAGRAGMCVMFCALKKLSSLCKLVNGSPTNYKSCKKNCAPPLCSAKKDCVWNSHNVWQIVHWPVRMMSQWPSMRARKQRQEQAQ